MKKLHILAMALLFAITGISFNLEAKNCPDHKHFATRTKCNKKGLCRTTSQCQWDKGYPKKLEQRKIAIENDHLNDQGSNLQPISLPFVQPITGGNFDTYAPQSFTPATSFDGPGLIGNYFSGRKTATIHDPSGENGQSYTFKNVTTHADVAHSDQLVLIGTYHIQPFCPDGAMCAQVLQSVDLYGALSQDNDDATDEDIANDTVPQNFLSDSKTQELLSMVTAPTTPMMGSNTSSFAPQTFQPASPFNRQGLIGNYFSKNKIATIHDPSGKNKQSYTFENVQAVSQSILPKGVLIGTFDTPDWVQPKMYCSGCKGKTTRLYGTLQETETDPVENAPIFRSHVMPPLQSKTSLAQPHHGAYFTKKALK